jgi:hypothetical protein
MRPVGWATDFSGWRRAKEENDKRENEGLGRIRTRKCFVCEENRSRTKETSITTSVASPPKNKNRIVRFPLLLEKTNSSQCDDNVCYFSVDKKPRKTPFSYSRTEKGPTLY